MQRDYLSAKPAEVITEFKVMAEESSVSPFVKVRNAKEFCYWLMSPDVIEQFISKRTDMAEAHENYPPLSDE